MNSGILPTILIVDDEESIREIMKIHLENQGYTVILSKDGEEAISALKNNDISLAITDIKMPKVDGFGVLDYISKYCNHIPVVVLTGYIDVETTVTSMKKGATDYVSKPVKRDKIIDVVKKALNKNNSIKKISSFEISGIYLLNEAGIILFNKEIGLPSEIDVDLFGSMFTAFKFFINDALHSNDGLRLIEHGNFKIMVEEGEGFFLVIVGKGDTIFSIKQDMKRIVKTINEKYQEEIRNWNGNVKEFDGIEKEFDHLFRNCNKIEIPICGDERE